MPSSQEVYREACKRLHRALGNYFAIRAWCSGSDCLILQRSVLEKVLQLERLKQTRMTWIKEDLKGWFPYITVLRYANESVGCLYLSRVDISMHTKGSMTDTARAVILRRNGIKTLTYNAKSTVPEGADQMLSELNLMAAGLSPATVIKLQSEVIKKS